MCTVIMKNQRLKSYGSSLNCQVIKMLKQDKEENKSNIRRKYAVVLKDVSELLDPHKEKEEKRVEDELWDKTVQIITLPFFYLS